MDKDANLCLKVVEEAKISHGYQIWSSRPDNERMAISVFAHYGVWLQDDMFQWNIRELITAPQEDLLYMLSWDKEVKE